MSTRAYWLMHFAIVPLLFASACFAGPAYTSPEEAAEADEDFAYQGEYWGSDGEGEEAVIVAVQLVAQGDGVFLAKLFEGGLPGEGGESFGPLMEMHREGGTLNSAEGLPLQFEIEGETLTATQADGSTMTLEKQHRESPTLGAEPPEGAVVLFDGTSVDAWQDGARMTEDGLLMEGLTSQETFGSHQLHLEFLLPYMPEDRGQGRANSGCYLQGRYETQILDSFGLEGLNNECGGVYEQSDPAVNMCFPPLSWQTYDIEFHEAQYDDEGKLLANARMTVKHNGVVVQDDLELPGPTRAAPVAAGPEPGPVYLQDHGNPVRFRNVWVLPLDEE